MTITQAEPATGGTPLCLRSGWRSCGEWVSIGALFVLLSFWYTDPLWRHPATYLPDPNDSLHNVCVSWWLSEKLLSGHWAGLWNLPPYFYPAHGTLAYDDPQIGVTLLGLPFFRVTGSSVLAYNAVVLLSIPLCALGAYALARHVTRSRGAALFAGIAWGFGAWHSGQAAHQQVLSLEGLPWILLMLHRYAETSRPRFLVGLFVFWTAQEYLCEYWGAFLVLLVVPFTLVLLRVAVGLPWRSVGAAFVAIGLAVLAWIPAQLPFLALATQGMQHSDAQVFFFSADLADYGPKAGTWLWGNYGSSGGGEFAVSPGLLTLLLAGLTCVRIVRHHRLPLPPEHAMVVRVWRLAGRLGPILVIAAGLLWALMKGWGVEDLTYFGLSQYWVSLDSVTRVFLLGVLLWANAPLRQALRGRRFLVRRLRDPRLAYVFLALLAILWSCGSEIRVNNLWIAPGIHTVLTLLPGTHGFRVLARMGVFADLALAILAAGAVSAGLRDWRRRGGATWQRVPAAALLALLVLADNVPRTGTTFAGSRAWLPPARPADSWLSAQPDAPLVELPFHDHDAQRMWYQTCHHKPMVNGYATFSPQGYGAEMRLLARPQAPAATACLHALGIRYLVLDHDSPFAVLPPPYTLRFTDSFVKVYTLDSGGPP